ncbi:hypothetical protein Aduo_013245 [Ancylostoma duodenale]
MKGTTRFFLDVKTVARVNDHFNDVHGICKRTKYCAKMQCSIDDFVFYGTNTELVLPKNFPKMDNGQKINVPCAHLSNTKMVEVRCNERGTLQPHPTRVNCTLGADDGEVDEIETPWNPRVRKSCDECHRLGTATCQQVEGGFICTCKHNWSGFICWKSPNQCGLSQLHCGSNGTCISEVDRAFCLCGEGYDGDQCEISKLELSFYAKNESSIISAVTGSALVITTSEILVMILRVILLLHCPKSGKDPQVFHQNMRSIVLSIASLLVLFFHHPAIFVISSFDCSMWFYVIITCYSLGVLFFALEALNLCEVSHMEQRNIWVGVMKETVFETPKMALRTFLTIVIFGGVVTAAAAAHFSQVITPWSCLGNFSEGTIDLWLPIVLINACAAIAANLFSYCGWLTLRNFPQFRQKMSIYLEQRDLSNKYSIEKCYRNVVFTALGPWLLCGMWLTLAISSDWVSDPVSNSLAKVFSILYTICNALQSVLTSGLYSTYIWYAMRFLPCKYAPAYDPVTLWTRWEVLERYRSRKKKSCRFKTMEKSHGNGRSYPLTAGDPDYVPILVRMHLQTYWMNKYAKVRTEIECSRSETINTVYMLESDEDHARMSSKAISDQIGFLFRQWATRVYETDPQPDAIKLVYEEAQAERLHTKFDEIWNSSGILPSPGPPKPEDCCKYFAAALTSYLKLFEYDPFQSCPLSVTDCYGNTQRLVFLRTPVDMLDQATPEDTQLSQNSEEDKKKEMKQRGRDEGGFDQWWMLTSEQKRIVQLQEYGDCVWEMAKLNYDYMELSKAL